MIGHSEIGFEEDLMRRRIEGSLDIGLMYTPSHSPGLIVEMLVYTGLIGGAMAMVMISPLRFSVACASEMLKLTSVRDIMLGRDLPYGVAIAGGAALTVGGRLLSAL